MKINKASKALIAVGCSLLLTAGAFSFFVLSAEAEPEVSVSDKKELARSWAEAWKVRDGSVRTAIMSADMLTDFRETQLRENGDADSTVIRWSSPWVTDYNLTLKGEGIQIDYTYTDSTETEYSSSEFLGFSLRQRTPIVSAFESLTELEIKP